MNYPIDEYFSLWFHGTTFTAQDTVFGIHIFWIARYGQILQFISGLTIIAELIGQEKLQGKINSIEAKVNLRRLWWDIVIVALYMWIFLLERVGWRKISAFRKNVIAHLDNKKKNKFSIRPEIAHWKQNEPEDFLNFKDYKSKQHIIVFVFAAITQVYIACYIIRFFVTFPWNSTEPFIEIDNAHRSAAIFEIIMAILGLILQGFLAIAACFFIYAPLIVVVLLVSRFFILFILEYLYFKPEIFYLKIAKRQRLFKGLAYIVLLIGTLISFFFS